MEKWNTPEGLFHIVGKETHPVWIVPDSIRKYRAQHGNAVKKIVPAGASNPMGDYALRLSNTAYLIHGTNDAVGVGRRSSAGCIRLYPEDIKQLFAMVKVGTPVHIINQPYKACLNANKVYLEAHIPLSEQRAKMKGDFSAAVQVVSKVHKNRDKQSIIKIAQEHLGIPLQVV